MPSTVSPFTRRLYRGCQHASRRHIAHMYIQTYICEKTGLLGFVKAVSTMAHKLGVERAIGSAQTADLVFKEATTK